MLRAEPPSSSNSASDDAAAGAAGDAPPSTPAPIIATIDSDLSQLETKLRVAVAAEDYVAAAAVKRDIDELNGGETSRAVSWANLGIPDWLADRTERLGYPFPTSMQQQAIKTVLLGADAVIRAETGSGKSLAFLLPLLSLLDYPPLMYPDDLKGPQAVIIVPHRELGVQLALLIYRLLGGSVNEGVPGERANMFTYFGPRGIKVKGCLDKEEVVRAKNAFYLGGTHVVVGTPECLAECLAEPQAMQLMSGVKAVVVDEADECWDGHREALNTVLEASCSQEDKPTFVFSGATISEALYSDLIKAGWLTYPSRVETRSAGGMPLGLKHRFVVRPDGMPAASVLAKLLRKELTERGPDGAVPRVMTFVQDADAAQAMANPLRNALWEEHRIGLVLPDGREPTKTLQDFKNNRTSMVLVTAAHARGLDLPAVSHVYSVGVPPSATEYVHRAGRAGRIGMLGAGVVTSIVTPAEVQPLRALLAELDLAVEEVSVEVPAVGEDGVNAEGAKKALEDVFNLY